MKKIISFLSTLLLSISVSTAFADDGIFGNSSSCAEWKSTVNADTASLDKLQKSVASDKPANGLSYTKSQFVVLLSKNLTKAKDTLANAKDKLPKTSEDKVDLRDVTLSGFNLSGLNLDNVDFRGSEMSGVDLSGSSLNGATLSKTELSGANLSNANLSYASLSKAKLGNANLCHATRVSADLEDAVLRGAYLKGAKLDMAKNIPKVIYLNSQNVLILGLAVPAD
jgi:uncharacterized protein YjbI with pentapeptide repeats